MSKQNSNASVDAIRLALCAALVERMYPNFCLFCEAVNHGGARLFRNTLNLVWEFASGRTDSINFSLQQEKLEPCIPRLEDFDIYGVRPAVDASAALILLLQACDARQEDDFQSLSKLSMGSIEDYLDAISYEGAYDEHPLVQRQLQLVEELQAAEREACMPESFELRQRVDQLRELGSDNGLSNIGISLVEE